MMKKNNPVVITWSRGLVISMTLLTNLSALAQSDSVLNRSVTVERDFQPVIQAAGKVATRPAVVETKIEPVEISFSDYRIEVTPQTTFQPLLSQPTRFAPAEPYHGYLRGALGHPNTLFDFGYHLDDGKRSILDVYAHHNGHWGLDALSRTKIGFDFSHPFTSCTVYFGINGGNIYYHKYGRMYDYSLANPGMWEQNRTTYSTRTFTPQDVTTLWTAEAFVGVQSNAKQDVQYKVQTGYQLFTKAQAVSEHQIRTRASLDWHSEAHHVGANLYVQNNFLQLSGTLASDIPDSLYNSRHNIRFQPYYAYHGNRFTAHIGVNLDMNIGRGQNSLSGIPNLTFAPSPHVHLEAQIAKQWLTLYADANGAHAMGTVQNFMESNRYRLIHAGIVSHHASSYTPVDAEMGFHIRPHRDLLIELHGGYALYLNASTLIASTDTIRYRPHTLHVLMQAGDFSYTYCDYARGKVGGQFNYHYRDILRVHLYGDYFFWKALRYEKNGYHYTAPCAELTNVLNDSSTTVYDRAKWQLGLRVDGRIDRHWSLYSLNRFVGSRLALATDGEHLLKPTVELDLGLQYDMWVGKKQVRTQTNGETILAPEPQPNLSFFFQLNNWLHRKNEIYYGYRSQGINCLLGLTFRF